MIIDKKYVCETCKVLRFLRKKFYFLQRFKHTLPIIDKKFVREICKVCAFCVKDFSFYSVLNTLYQSSIENLGVKDARSLLFTRRISLFTVFLTRSSDHWVNFPTWKMQGLRYMRLFKYALMEFDFRKNCVPLLCAFFKTLGWIVCFMNKLILVEWNKRLVKAFLRGDRGHQGIG